MNNLNIIKIGGNVIDNSENLYHFLKDVGEDTKSFLAKYRQQTLVHLIKRTFGLDVEVRISAETSTSPLMSRFEVYS